MNLIWATRGRSWGFRFLLDSGYADPLDAYERAFAGTGDAELTCRRVGDRVALRFPDPDGRLDHAGRVIPHDVVVMPPHSTDIRTVQDGLAKVWPLLAAAFAAVWDLPTAPAQRQIDDLVGRASSH
ncbi:hypothetical protein [Isoptericola dokdonensis]|uniref:Uncharacterized protein n=1 Tax=Isoptericola dokdonensis DS-3 TaxID=1300344 RepID=A0A168FJK4_9MICO|nr:hypothetical protein [Isoptericola dokdonensis]ANC31956.1 hypothetical protein I598_2419 [Isoptericola dokdonensis DS-3]